MASKKKLPEEPAPKETAPEAPAGLVRCRVHTGSYIADRTYATGEVVFVLAEEVPPLAHCLLPEAEEPHAVLLQEESA